MYRSGDDGLDFLGAVPIDPPIVGPWPASLRHLPDDVEFDGATFRREDFWAWNEPGIRAQYREVRCENSRHMKVTEDWRFFIDHVDAANPSCGPEYAAKHLVKDSGPKDWARIALICACGRFARVRRRPGGAAPLGDTNGPRILEEFRRLEALRVHRSVS